MSRIEQLIDEIEEYVEGCKPAPFSQSKIIVQKEQLYELLTELRLKTPDEIKRYQKIIAQKDKIISDAQAQAEQMIEETTNYANALVEEHEIMLKAYEKAEQTINAANAQAEEIAQARAERAERSALKSYFQQQGMSEDQVTQAIADYKAQQKKNQPNVTQMQQDLADARNEVQQMKNEKLLASKGVKTDDLDYVLYKVSKMTDEKTSFEKAADKYLKENPRFTSGSGYRVSTSTGNASNGSVENVNATINDAIRSAARR